MTSLVTWDLVGAPSVAAVYRLGSHYFTVLSRFYTVFTSDFYRAMHFSAKRGIAIACRLSVCLSVCNVGEL